MRIYMCIYVIHIMYIYIYIYIYSIWPLHLNYMFVVRYSLNLTDGIAYNIDEWGLTHLYFIDNVLRR